MDSRRGFTNIRLVTKRKSPFHDRDLLLPRNQAFFEILALKTQVPIKQINDDHDAPLLEEYRNATALK